MAPEKHNVFLEATDSEDELPHNSDSDFDREVKKGGRSSKRRKPNPQASSDDSEADFSDAADSDADTDAGSEDTPHEQPPSKASRKSSAATPPTARSRPAEPLSRKVDSDTVIIPSSAILKRATHPHLKKDLVLTEPQIKASGVLYLSRIPPFMKPHKLRSLLSPYGTINRTFLSQEDPVAHSRRVRAGGNKKKNYTEGWVEFVSKRDARRACDLLNARTIGGKKGSYYRDDVWIMRYLNGFKWVDLMEQMTKEAEHRKMEQAKQLMQAKKGNRRFQEDMERVKMVAGVQKTREKRQQKHVA